MTKTGQNVIRRAVGAPVATPPAAIEDGVPEYIAEEAPTGEIDATELDRHTELLDPRRAKRDTLEMPPVAIHALCIASMKPSDAIERGTTKPRRGSTRRG